MVPRLALIAAAALFLSPHAKAAETADKSNPTISGDSKDDARWVAAIGRCIKIIKTSAGKRREAQMRRLDATGREQSENYKAQVYLARAFLSVSEARRAMRRAERAVYLAPDDQEAHIVLGLSYLQAGYKPKAAVEARKILAAEPDNKGAAELLRASADSEK
jgi:tetratricopeptide (TPR) repeat protein